MTRRSTPSAPPANTKAWGALGKDAEQTLIDYSQLGNRLAGSLFDRSIEDLMPLQQEVVQCLADDGEPVTAASDQLYGFTSDVELGTPVEYPERSGPQQSTGVEIVPADTEQTYVPTAAEAALAVGFYNCSIETGTREEFAALATEAKKAAVAEHGGELEKFNPRITELAATAGQLTGR